MTNLTEQWKKGGLKKDKKYYTKDKLGRTYIKTYNKRGFKGLVEEVLCEVPSYEKWNAVLESNENLFKTIQVLKKRLVEVTEENAELKDLLKDLIDEAEGALQAIQKDCESDDWSIFNYPEVQYFYTLKDKIDEVLK